MWRRIRRPTNLTFRAGEADTVARPSSADYEWYRAHQSKGNFTLYDLGPELSTTFMFFNLNEQKAAPRMINRRWDT